MFVESGDNLDGGCFPDMLTPALSRTRRFLCGDSLKVLRVFPHGDTRREQSQGVSRPTHMCLQAGDPQNCGGPFSSFETCPKRAPSLKKDTQMDICESLVGTNRLEGFLDTYSRDQPVGCVEDWGMVLWVSQTWFPKLVVCLGLS